VVRVPDFLITWILSRAASRTTSRLVLLPTSSAAPPPAPFGSRPANATGGPRALKSKRLRELLYELRELEQGHSP